MTFSAEWNEVYASGRERIQWPWTDLVSLVNRHCGDLTGKRVLELGCGTGANIAFFVSAGADYLGIEGSAEAAVIAVEDGAVLHGDFTRELPGGPFDLICDRAAVAHNDTASIEACLALAHDALKPGGLYIGVDWFSHNHDEYANGEPDVDEFTKTGYTEGQFAGVGRVHFSDEQHMRWLFSRFDLLRLEEKTVCQASGSRVATWNIVARKA